MLPAFRFATRCGVGAALAAKSGLFQPKRQVANCVPPGGVPHTQQLSKFGFKVTAKAEEPAAVELQDKEPDERWGVIFEGVSAVEKGKVGEFAYSVAAQVTAGVHVDDAWARNGERWMAEFPWLTVCDPVGEPPQLALGCLYCMDDDLLPGRDSVKGKVKLADGRHNTNFQKCTWGNHEDSKGAHMIAADNHERHAPEPAPPVDAGAAEGRRRAAPQWPEGDLPGGRTAARVDCWASGRR